MVLSKLQKKNLVDGLSDRFSRAKTAIFTNYQGLKVNELDTLRSRLKEKGIEYKITKNTLVRIVLKDRKLNVDDAILDKPAAIAFGYDDEVEPSRIVYQFTKGNDKIKILGAIVNGEYVDVNTVKSLALLPSREELYAKVVGSIAAPLSGLVNVMAGNLRGLVSVLRQYGEQKSK